MFFTLAMVATHARRSRIGSQRTFNERSSPKGSYNVNVSEREFTFDGNRFYKRNPVLETLVRSYDGQISLECRSGCGTSVLGHFGPLKKIEMTKDRSD